MSCNRCKKTSTNPLNFLLSCSECGKRWHHRCHIPPLSDPELTALIRATNNNDIDNGLSSWIGRCCKKKRVQAQTTAEVRVLGRATLRSPLRPLCGGRARLLFARFRRNRPSRPIAMIRREIQHPGMVWQRP
ncbi:hypothetical protein EDB85DRAFT_2287550 [Lactarius pseudohatsudake]|nr:hypothetical protein EDB85DRAFT_2287550 [Lactarius pseudohatsudake]